MMKLRRRRFLCVGLVVFVGLFCAYGVRGQNAVTNEWEQYGIPNPTVMEGTTPAQWRILWTGDAQTTATVSWSTAEESARNVVYFDTVARDGQTADYANKQEAGKNGQYTGGTSYYHHAQLTKLTPGTTCYFVLESDGKTSKEMHFKTAPAEDVQVGVIFGSDSRGGSGGIVNVIRMYLNFNVVSKFVEANDHILCFVFGGDYIHDGTSFAQWDQWMSDHELITSASGRVLPLIPARGNHEMVGPLYCEIFDGAGDCGNDWYATQVGPQLGIVTLNSQVTNEKVEEQHAFMKKTIPELRKNSRWLVAQYHIPLYPTAKYKVAPPFKPQWLEIFDANNVDLAVESDGHTLKRTHLMRGDVPDPTGTLYIGDGGYGAPQRSPRPQSYHAFTSAQKAFIFVVDFCPDKMFYQCFNIDSQVVDSFALDPKKK